MAETREHPSISFRRLIGTGISAKLLIDIGQQIFNPFLPVIAAGMGMDVVSLGRLVGLRSLMGIFAPLSGELADRTSYRLVIRMALLLNAAGFLLVGVSQGPWVTAVGMILAGLGAGAFVPMLQAYVSGHLAYSIRAQRVGDDRVLMGVDWHRRSFAGWGIDRTDQLAAAVSPAGCGYGGNGLCLWVHAGDAYARGTPHGAGGSVRRSPLALLHLGSNMRSTYGAIAAGGLSYFAAMQVMLAHGAWLEQQYGLGPAQLGLVAFVFGWFDLAASVAVSLFTDRIGKRRSVLLGIAGSLAGYLVMPLFNTGVVAATIAIAVTRMFFEFNIVSHFPLLSEQSPAQRGKVMTTGAAVALIGATLAGFSGPWLLVNVGVAGLSWLSAAAVSVALVIVLFLVHEK